MPPRQVALALVWIAPALLSSNYIIARAAAGVVPPHVLALGRWTFALLLLLPFVMRDLPSMRTAAKTEWPTFLLLGALGMWICGAFVYIGAETTTATNIGLIYAATPVGVAAAGRWFLGENMSSCRQAALWMALGGVLIVISRGDPNTILQVQFTVGDLWIVTAGISWIAYSVLQQLWPSTLHARQRLACIMAGGLVFLLPGAAWDFLQVGWPTETAKALLLIGLAGLVPGFLSYQAYAVMVRDLGATHAGVIMYLSPVYAAGWAWWLLGETPRWFHLAGAALILPSVYLVGRR